MSRDCEVRDCGRLGYAEALELQERLVEERKAGRVPDQLVFVEHPHVITLGRNGHMENLLAPEVALERAGIAFYRTRRGGDITYHGPGQIVGYPVFDLREWKRDVVGYVRAVEEALIEAVGGLGVNAERMAGHTGVWVGGRKLAAIGVHISRWVTSHGFALNHRTELSYFRYIVPCGLTLPVTSLEDLGTIAPRERVREAIVRGFERVFELKMRPASDGAGILEKAQ